MSAETSRQRQRRPIRSCLECRARRVKCDQGRPACGECRRLRRACRYDTRGPTTRDHISPDPPPPAVARPEQTSSSNTVQSASLGFFDTSIGGSSKWIGPSFWGISMQSEPEFSTFLIERDHYSPLDSAHCCTICYPHLARLSDHGASTSAIDESRMYGSLHTLDEVIAALPPRHICDKLLAGFMQSIYPLISILHLPTFFHQYEEFWASTSVNGLTLPPSGVLGEYPTFVALLVACLSFGSLVENITLGMGISASSAKQSRNLRDLAVQCLNIFGFPRSSTVYSLAAFIILHVPGIREESERSVMFIGVAYRAAMSLGLHRDPIHLKIGTAEKEVRRRLWWHIIHRDTIASLSSGQPPMVTNSRHYDTSTVSENVELSHEYGPGASLIGSSHARTPVDCRQFVSVARFLVSDGIRTLLERQNDPKPWDLQEVAKYRTILEQTAEIVKTRIHQLNTTGEPGPEAAQLPANLDPFDTLKNKAMKYWTLESTQTNHVFLKWSAKVLPLMLDRMFCILFCPFQRRADRNIWREIRERTIGHCHDYLQQYISLCTDSIYGVYQWFYPGNFQPIQATACILVDVLENPRSSEAVLSRQLVDKVFSLLDHEQGVTAGKHGSLEKRRLSNSGSEAWKMLSRLRRKTWLASSLDPDARWICARQHDTTAMPVVEDVQNPPSLFDEFEPFLYDHDFQDFEIEQDPMLQNQQI